MTFDTFNLHKRISSRVKALGFTTPTPIQEQAIPPALEGHDIMGLAQTGTGKTAAYVLPILEKLFPQGPKRAPRALVVAPTRELAEQIREDFSSLGSKTGLKCMSIYGGVGQNPQVNRLKAGVDIVVACPGRLLDLINQGKVKLSRIEFLVIDEADRMFDMGFLPDIRKIVRNVPERRQVMLFSATMPREIRGLANDFMKNPVTIQIGHTAPVETVSHALYPVQQHLKADLLLNLLKETNTESVLIFTRTKHRAKRLDRQLNIAGYPTASLQGNLSQSRRQAALDGFKNGEFQMLVATDIAARGIDVNTISHVINFDIPETADSYTHRIGRTGRATRSGDAFTFVTPQDEAIVRSIERVIGSRVERRTLGSFDYRKPAAPGPNGDRPFPGRNGSRGSSRNTSYNSQQHGRNRPQRNTSRNSTNYQSNNSPRSTSTRPTSNQSSPDTRFRSSPSGFQQSDRPQGPSQNGTGNGSKQGNGGRPGGSGKGNNSSRPGQYRNRRRQNN
jgi:ATP-dependent RNA helicase RhlE